MTKMTKQVATGVLSGVVRVSGFFTSSVVNSKAGKKFFSLLPGEMILASLDGFSTFLNPYPAILCLYLKFLTFKSPVRKFLVSSWCFLSTVMHVTSGVVVLYKKLCGKIENQQLYVPVLSLESGFTEKFQS